MADDKKKVLIVDDEADIREFLQSVLEEEGYELLTACDGEEGLRVAREKNPEVVILDVQMPKKDGFQVFHELRNGAATRGIRVIMLTGVAERTGFKFDGQAMGEFLGSEPDAYIDKPVAPEKIQETVRKLTER